MLTHHSRIDLQFCWPMKKLEGPGKCKPVHISRRWNLNHFTFFFANVLQDMENPLESRCKTSSLKKSCHTTWTIRKNKFYTFITHIISLTFQEVQVILIWENYLHLFHLLAYSNFFTKLSLHSFILTINKCLKVEKWGTVTKKRANDSASSNNWMMVYLLGFFNFLLYV